MKEMTYNKRDKEMDNKFLCWFKIGRILDEHNLDIVALMDEGEPVFDLVKRT